MTEVSNFSTTLNMSADPEKAMEVVDDNDHESLDEDEEDGDKMEVS